MSNSPQFHHVVEKRAQAKKKASKNPAADKRLRHLLIVPERVTGARFVVVQPPFKRLAIDYSYQREEVKGWVNDLADAIRRGSFPPAIHVAERKWEAGDTLWIVDGQQRFWAHWDAGKPIRCQVHSVRTPQEEKDLFVVLNSIQKLSPNTIIKDAPGPTALMIRAAAEESGPLAGRIAFSGAVGRRIAANSLLCGLSALLSGRNDQGVSMSLSSCDRAIAETPELQERAKEFVLMVGVVWPSPDRPRVASLRAVGRCLRKTGNPPMTAGMMTRLKKIKWESIRAATSAEWSLLCDRRVYHALGAKTALGGEEAA